MRISRGKTFLAGKNIDFRFLKKSPNAVKRSDFFRIKPMLFFLYERHCRNIVGIEAYIWLGKSFP